MLRPSAIKTKGANIVNSRTITKLAIIPLITWPAAIAQARNEGSAPRTAHQSHATRQSSTQPHTRTTTKAKITVQNSEAKPFDQTASPELTEVHITETFAGDIDAESTVRALQLQRDDHSATLVSLQRVRGKLGRRQGPFVLQGSETVENGKIKATWFVVPGSGTGELAGLRGEGGFQGQFGKASDGTLDYWFE